MNDKEFKQRIIIALAGNLQFEEAMRAKKDGVASFLAKVASEVCDKLNEQDDKN